MIKGVRAWFSHLSNISRSAEIGVGTVLHAGVHIHDLVKIGRNCLIEAQVFIPNGVTIQDNVFVGPHVCFTNDPDIEVIGGNFLPTPTLVKTGAKIGANSTIKAGIVLGANCRIGMGSVVTHSVPDGETWYGNPARKH